jgi:hypothetical protein
MADSSDLPKQYLHPAPLLDKHLAVESCFGDLQAGFKWHSVHQVSIARWRPVGVVFVVNFHDEHCPRVPPAETALVDVVEAQVGGVHQGLQGQEIIAIPVAADRNLFISCSSQRSHELSGADGEPLQP